MTWLEPLLLLVFGFLFTQFRYQATTFPPTWHAFLLTLVLFFALVEPLVEVFPALFRWRSKLKWAAVLGVIGMTLIWSTLTAVKMRHLVGEEYPIHDNPIQLEESAKFLAAGKNPYRQSFQDTPLGSWLNWKDNPSINHVVTLPFYVVSTAVVTLTFDYLFGVMDGRIVHWLALLLVGAIFYWSKIDGDKKRLLTILFFLNPLFVHFFIDGRNDIMVFSLVMSSLWFLSQKRWHLAAVFLGLAGATKQHSWLLFPLYFAFTYSLEKKQDWRLRLKGAWQKVWLAPAVMGLWLVPFLFWDARAFIEDVILYPAGKVALNYPIKGHGFSVNLVDWGVIGSAGESFPFWIIEVLVCLPLFVFLVKYLRLRPTVKTLTRSYMWLLLVFWLFSRFFLENYVGYLSMLLIAAELFPSSRREGVGPF